MAAGLRDTCPSITGVGDVRQVFYLSTNLAADEDRLRSPPGCPDDRRGSCSTIKTQGFSFSYVMFKEISLLCDILTGVPRPVVPAKFCRCVFLLIHNLAHAGAIVTRRLLTRRWVWKGMQGDVSRWCKEFIPCQVSKVTKHTVPALREIPVPSRRFTKVNIDIVGPLPPSQGFPYLFTMIYGNTRWLEVAELVDVNATSVVAGFVSTWVSRYGVPVAVVTDRGSQFTGELWSMMCKKLHISHRTTTAYHPESNGIMERFHRSLKASLRAKCQTASWSLNCPSLYLVSGQLLVNPTQFRASTYFWSPSDPLRRVLEHCRNP